MILRVLRATMPVCAAATALITIAAAAEAQQRMTIPDVPAGEPRLITADDIARLRRIETLSVSPDGRRFAVLVRQGDPVANVYRKAWFAGRPEGGVLTFVSDGGSTRLARDRFGKVGLGTLERSPAPRWSPDGRWLAHSILRNGEVQVWRSRIGGASREQLTRNAADVRDFEWSEDGRSLYFTVGAPRAEQQAWAQSRERAGYRYDDDLSSFTDFMAPQMDAPVDDSAKTVWTVTLKESRERVANETERAAFERAQGRGDPTRGAAAGAVRFGTTVQALRDDGARAWLVRSKEDTMSSRVNAALPGSPSDTIECAATECAGLIERLWWVGDSVLFWRREGMRFSAQGIYTWTPASGVVKTILSASSDFLQQCELAAGPRLLCVRETATQPPHVAAIDIHAGGVHVLADINPEFRNIRLGKVERFEWDTPKFSWDAPGQPLHGLYAERAYGYIFYPPDFDPTQKYPVYINPYAADGFENQTTQETPSHVFAAHGMVVLNTSFPQPTRNLFGLGRDILKLSYSAELGYPHLTMYAESTLRGLDIVIARGFVDERRVGIGGISHGTFVPLFIVQKHDRIAAVSIASATWAPIQYYMTTGKVRQRGGESAWMVKPEGGGADFWSGIDLADHMATIEAPILMNIPATEMPTLIRLVRHMADAGKPYDAYVFGDETHMKWQPAHIHAIVQRNLDWFDFWLQDREDPDPAKAEQYARWRKLKEQHPADRAKRAEGH